MFQVVTSSAPGTFTPHPDWLREQIAIAEHIISSVVFDAAQAAVREATRELIHEYMGREAGVRTRIRDDLAVYLEVEVSSDFLLSSAFRFECKQITQARAFPTDLIYSQCWRQNFAAAFWNQNKFLRVFCISSTCICMYV
jgi:hypothetical protein